MHPRTHTYMRAKKHARANAQALTLIHLRTHIYSYMNTDIQMYTHTFDKHMHTDMYMHIHTGTYMNPSLENSIIYAVTSSGIGL